MIERVERNGVIIPCMLFGIIALLMLLKESSSLATHPHFTFYLVGRLLIVLSFVVCIVLSLLHIEFIFGYFPVIFYFLGTLYEIHGQTFQPNYWLAYIEFSIIFPFIFNIDKRLLAGLMASGLLAFDVVFITTSRTYIEKGLFGQELSGDILIGTIIATIIAYVTAETFIAERTKKNQIYQRFIDLGKNISSIAHDVKGMISGPCTGDVSRLVETRG